MRIKVTQDDIDRGRPVHPGRCPVALALHRATGEDWRVGCVEAVRMDDLKCVGLSKAVSDFVLAFDRLENVKPISFDWEV